MLKMSGLVLDVHDDIRGEIVRSIFPTQEDIPEIIKQAHALTSEEKERLPDDDFALVLVDEEHKLRKFACHDAGNTALSVLYFLKNANKLPEEAQKTAAANLLVACGWYGLDVPEELEKAAAGIGTALTAIQLPGAVSNVKKSIQGNMQSIRELESVGHKVVTPHQMMGKHADVSGSTLAPNSAPACKAAPKSTVNKVATIHKEDFGPEEGKKSDYTHGTQPLTNPQAKVMKPHVDVSNATVPSNVQVKKASQYALGNKYPLDSYEQVKKASSYFDEYKHHLSPVDRREYCLNLVKRASELDIPLSHEAYKYGSEGYAPLEEIKMALAMRKNVTQDVDQHSFLNELEEKIAELSPDNFCRVLEEFDKTAGLHHDYDGYLMDPYYSTYGVVKEAEYSEVIGNDMVNASMLEYFAKWSYQLLSKTFGPEMADEFRKDPVGIFKSLPVDEKKVIMRMANNTSNEIVL